MGIELPPELAPVAAQAGVTWPEADEEAMRRSAQAWRDAGTKLTTLTRDADSVASTALNAVEGKTGDAARQHWSAFVQPDTGHLTSAVRGCTAAADRLDHAANQVGTAKVEIVRNLIALAKTSDAANQAAGAGHPQALLNLDTAVRGTAVNVAHITDNLVTAVQPTSGVDMSGVHNLVNATPGAALPVDLPAGPADLLPDVGPDAGGAAPGDEPSPGNPEITGPVRIQPGGMVDLPPDAPTPPTGIGQTVQAGFAGAPVVEPAAPAAGNPAAGALGGAAAAPGAGAAAGGPAPGFAAAPGGAPPGGGVPGGAPAPGAGGPAPVGDRQRVGAELGKGQQTTAVPPGPPPPAQQAAPAPPAAPAKDRRDAGGVPFWVHMFPIGHMPVVSDRPSRQLPPPPMEVDYAPGMRFEPGDHPEHHLVDSAQRLDELGAGVPPITAADGLPADHALVALLAEGHDPLGGGHERDWDRRYLVRLGSVTPHGISSEGKEYAWPPGEISPEGGTAPGEPELLVEGAVIDRFGSPDGRVFSLDGTEFARRSLPPETLEAGYHRYRVTRRIPVWRTVSAPWFGQPGGGERYRTTYSAAELLALGYLADITGVEQ